jgi:hypothetical protein
MATYSNDAKIELCRESATLEQRLVPITQELNAHALRVNPRTWLQNYESAQCIADQLIEFCRYLAKDESFRPNSPVDCRKALGISVSDRDTLLGLSNDGNHLAEAVIDARGAIAALSQLRKWSSVAEFGFVQPIWDSLGTPHGRYTSELPCLNNRIKPIRQTIEPLEGWSFLSLDLSQAEYVCWASLSGDLALSELFLAGRDFHSEMATAVQDAVPTWNLRGAEPRAAGKTLNFSILYLMTPFTLAGKLGCPVSVARKIIKAYYKRARVGVKYIHRVLSDARELGFVETRFGRRRFCWELQNGLSDRDRHEVEKTCWSHHNAGTAAEVTKLKQAEVWETLRQEGFGSDQVRLSIQMYDQTIWSMKTELMRDVRPIVEEVWSRRVPGFLPFRSKITQGGSWGEL